LISALVRAMEGEYVVLFSSLLLFSSKRIYPNFVFQIYDTSCCAEHRCQVYDLYIVPAVFVPVMLKKLLRVQVVNFYYLYLSISISSSYL
jgi:hypothetical protein